VADLLNRIGEGLMPRCRRELPKRGDQANQACDGALPFGEPYPPSAPVVETRRFGGKERDAETGLDYFGARHYSSLNGRFTTVDPVLQIELALTNPQRWDRYAYAGNNPLRFIDPDGADFWDFVNGVSDAMRANFAFGIGRSTGGNSDFVIGQRVGDVISLAGSAIETVGGFGTMSGGVAACGTGVGCLAGAPAIAGGAVLTTHGVGMGAAASVSLMQGIGDGGNGSSLEVTPTTDKLSSNQYAVAQRRGTETPERFG
jgi:RHS repeat-associated protein